MAKKDKAKEAELIELDEDLEEFEDEDEDLKEFDEDDEGYDEEDDFEGEEYNDEGLEDEHDLGITKERVAEATSDFNTIYKEGAAVAKELKDAFDDIKSAFNLGDLFKK